MKQWNYILIPEADFIAASRQQPFAFLGGALPLQEFLNQWGRDGFELVAIANGFFIFKKEAEIIFVMKGDEEGKPTDEEQTENSQNKSGESETQARDDRAPEDRAPEEKL